MKDELLLSAPIVVPGHQALSIRLTEHKGILMGIDGVVVVTALLVGLWFGAQMSNWIFSFQLIFSYSPWFVAVTGLYLVLATVNDAYKPKIASDAVASFVALLKTSVEILVLYLLLYSLIYLCPAG